jgi:hypothetical protein
MLAATSGVVPSDMDSLFCLAPRPMLAIATSNSFQAALNNGKELPAVGGQFDATRGAVEQSEAHATLQLFDQHAEARGRDVQRLSSARETQRLMAKRANATVAEAKGSHAIYVSQPKAVAELIEKAAMSLSK